MAEGLLESGERAPPAPGGTCEESDSKLFISRHPGDRDWPDLLGRHAQRANRAVDGAGSADGATVAGYTTHAAALDATHAESTGAADRDVACPTVFAIANQQPDAGYAVSVSAVAEPDTFDSAEPDAGPSHSRREQPNCADSRRR